MATVRIRSTGHRDDNLEKDAAGNLFVTLSGASSAGTVDTELPAAALLAEDAATPTAPAVSAFQRIYDGATWDFPRTPTVFKPLDAVAINPAASVWTPAAGKKFRLMGYHLSSSVAGNILLKDGASGTVIAVIPSEAGGSGVHVHLGNGKLSAVANNVLEALGPATSTVSGIVYGTEE